MDFKIGQKVTLDVGYGLSDGYIMNGDGLEIIDIKDDGSKLPFMILSDGKRNIVLLKKDIEKHLVKIEEA